MYLFMAACLVLTGVSAGLGILYYGGVIFSFVVFIAAIFMVRKNPIRSVAYRGFCLNAWGGVILLAFIVADLNLFV